MLIEKEVPFFSRFNKQTKKYTYFLQTRIRILPRYENLSDIIEITGSDKILAFFFKVEPNLSQKSENEKRAFIRLLEEKSDPERNLLLEEKYKSKYSNTNILHHLNRRSLAVWFIDNGGKSKKSFYIDIEDSYKKERIQYILLKRWSIKTWFYKKNEKSTKLFVLKEPSSHFKNIVSPYVFQSMRNKLSHII